ncbi:MAG: class I SAM-dependent methyltransferase [Desulfobacterales bacterium]|nr:class I SAM-dependent methyltransferase [Desulfobacterales bacterium]
MMMSLICFMCYGKWNFKSAYNTIYQGQEKSALFKEIVKTVFKDEFPEDADTLSFLTMSDLNRLTGILALKKGEQLADIACGRGGPGMWVARKTGAAVRGVDISEEAVAAATRRIPDFGLERKAEFGIGSFYATGLETHGCDGIMSVDALWLAPDRNRALREISRVLKPGGRFAFTTWDGNIPFMPDDHKKNLEDSGFDIEVYEETRGWKERQLAVYEGIINAKAMLEKEMGKRLAAPIIKEAKSTPPVLDKSRRIIVGARKRQYR